MSQATIKNDVNLDDLMTAIEAVKEDSANGKLTFTVHSKWENGFKARHTTGGFKVGKDTGNRNQDHSLSTDEPLEILGGDAGISPAETLISSLGACLTVGYAANAAAMGIDLEELHNYVNEHSPIWDTICNPVSISSEIVAG